MPREGDVTIKTKTERCIYKPREKLRDTYGKNSPPRASRKNHPSWHLNIGYPASRITENKFLFFKPQHLWYFATTALGNEYKHPYFCFIFCKQENQSWKCKNFPKILLFDKRLLHAYYVLLTLGFINKQNRPGLKELPFQPRRADNKQWHQVNAWLCRQSNKESIRLTWL